MPELAPFSASGQFWRGNLHTHSTMSDGRLTPQQVIEAYKARGYDFVQLSEHFLKFFNWPITDTRKFRSDDFTTIIGAELHALATSVGEYWHILATGLPLDFAPCGDDETPAAIARRAADAGAFITLAHPAWSQLTIDDGMSIDAAHSLEIYNTGCSVENDRGDGSYLLDQMLNKARRLTCIATDDAHFHTGDFDAFGGWINVKAEKLEPDALVAAMIRGNYYSTQGPQIHSVSIDDNIVSVSSSPVNSISLIGGTSRTSTRLGKSICSARLDLAELEHSFAPAPPSPWLRLVIIDEHGKRAWTNPIWLDEL